MKRILIANRAEIACRVARSAHALGYETVAVFSDADRGALHTRVADLAVHIGPSTAAESYLDVARILDAAQRTGADAIHPGYGFLAENAAFAQACADAGLVFIGPPPEAIRLMGSKRQAKLRMEAAGVPVVPGYSGGEQSVEVLTAEAAKLGLPLMIKASAGGGGRGLRLVTKPEQLAGALASARSEAESSFGDGELILERAVLRPRHVEIQVFADQHGHVIHLGERDCSVQRRHQKVIEEAPSPAVSPELRAQMGEAAVAAARAIGYVGAGTVEMLVDEEGRFYFMEMNTRLQVEHPVTELVTGLDLVAWQLDVAAGRPLPMTQDELRIEGHAIEARVYAEDPYAGFLPQVGTVSRLVWPQGEGVRVDHGLREGQEVTPFYDAMVGKVIAHGRDREEARRRLVRALADTVVHGVVTNQGYLTQILEHEVFARGEARTDFVEAHLGDATRPAPDDEVWAIAAALFVGADGTDHWRSTGYGAAPVRLSCQDEERRALVSGPAAARTVVLGERTVVLAHLEVGAEARLEVGAEDRAEVRAKVGAEVRAKVGTEVRVEVDGVARTLAMSRAGDTVVLTERGATFELVRLPASDAAGAEETGSAIRAPMSGKVIELRTEVGRAIAKGEVLVVLEAMKMQMELTSPRAGVVRAVHVEAGDQVDNKQTLVELEEES